MKTITSIPKQKQSLPGHQSKMHPEPEVIRKNYMGSNKLQHKVALITGGDSGIGRSVAVHFAREGADVAIVYLSEINDAKATKALVEKEGSKCILLKGDISKPAFCKKVIVQTIEKLGQLNVVVNNAATQVPQDHLTAITEKQVLQTFKTNIFPFFTLTKYALPHLQSGDSIINTTSVTAYRGSDHLIDYASTKGAIVAFTRSLSANLASKNIRVNGVAPGPIWTPLIPASFDDVTDFGKDTPLGRVGQPSEVAPAYVFLACEDSSYITGQVIHVNGGEIIGS